MRQLDAAMRAGEMEPIELRFVSSGHHSSDARPAVTQHVKQSAFEAQDTSPKLGDEAAKAAGAETGTSQQDDLVAWAGKAIEQNPGLAIAGAVAAGALIACLVVQRSRPSSEFARLQKRAMAYGDRLERRAQRELSKIDNSKAFEGLSDFVSTYGSQLGGVMSGLATQAQHLLDQARRTQR